jgi:hypothetical protein
VAIEKRDATAATVGDARLAELRACCTEKQARLAEEFLKNGGNATQAARRAGYKGKAATLAVTASQTLRSPRVISYLEGLRLELQQGSALTLLERVRERLWLIGSGMPVPQYVRGAVVRMPPKLSDQRAALRTLAQMLGGLDPRTRFVITPNVRAELEALRSRMPEEAFIAMLEALRDLAEDRGEVDVARRAELAP